MSGDIDTVLSQYYQHKPRKSVFTSSLKHTVSYYQYAANYNTNTSCEHYNASRHLTAFALAIIQRGRQQRAIAFLCFSLNQAYDEWKIFSEKRDYSSISVRHYFDAATSRDVTICHVA